MGRLMLGGLIVCVALRHLRLPIVLRSEVRPFVPFPFAYLSCLDTFLFCSSITLISLLCRYVMCQCSDLSEMPSKADECTSGLEVKEQSELHSENQQEY